MLLDDPIGVDDEHIAARLIAAHGDLRDQQRLLRAQRHPHAKEIARQERLFGILEDPAHLQRSGRLVDVGGHVIEHALVRIAGLGLQADFDRNLVDQLGDSDAALRHLRTHALHVTFAQNEPYPDRVELHDGREFAGVVAADQFADRNLARRHDAVEGSRNRGVAEIDLRGLGLGLRLQHARAGGVAGGACSVEIGLRRHVLGLEFLLTREFGFGIDQRRLGALFRGLGLFELNLVRLRLDYE